MCDCYGLYKLKDNRVKCKHCKRYYSLNKIRKDIDILYYFYLEISARKTAKEMNIDYGTIHRKFNCELELDKTYLGGRRKGKIGRRV